VTLGEPKVTITILVTDVNSKVYVYPGQLTKAEATARACEEDSFPKAVRFACAHEIIDGQDARRAALTVRRMVEQLRAIMKA